MIYIKRTIDLFRSRDFRHAMKIEIRPVLFNFAIESFQQHGGYNERAILELLTEKPFEHITIKDISNKAMVGHSTFYHYYLDKYDLVDNLIKDSLDDYEKTLHQRLTDSTCLTRIGRSRTGRLS